MYFAAARAAAWPISHLLLAGLSAVAISVFAKPAAADEAYLCGPDRIIYVSVADLPEMKRTNPCIAAYYGLKVEAGVEQAQASASANNGEGADTSAGPALKKSRAHAALKPLVEPDTTTTDQGVIRHAALRPVAAPGTDFRNVRILNAASDEAAIFRHTR